MRFFKRDSGGSTPTDFWSWWAEGRDRVAQAIATGGFDQRLIGEISSAIQTIHPSMAWELSPGRTAQHAFCVSPEGNAELRQAALRWLASAPPPDANWEYHASKQAAPKLMASRWRGSGSISRRCGRSPVGIRFGGAWTSGCGIRDSTASRSP